MSPAHARQILGVDAGSDKAAVQNAYRDLAKVWHPDRFASENDRLRSKAEERFKEIQAAYDLLTKPAEIAYRARSDSGQTKPGDKWVLQQPRISMLRFWLILIGLTAVALRFGLIFRSLLVSVIVIAGIVWLTMTLSKVRFKV